MTSALDRLVGLARGSVPVVRLRPASRFEDARQTGVVEQVVEQVPSPSPRAVEAVRIRQQPQPSGPAEQPDPPQRAPAAPAPPEPDRVLPELVEPVVARAEPPRPGPSPLPAPTPQLQHRVEVVRDQGQPHVQPAPREQKVHQSPVPNARPVTPQSAPPPAAVVVPPPEVLLEAHILPALVTERVVAADAVPGPSEREDVEVVELQQRPSVEQASPAEIHVHIGAVQVRQPAPAREVAAAAPQVATHPVVDLDAYLSARREDRR